MSKLEKRVWSKNLTDNTKMLVYRGCVLSTLQYSSETWTTYAAQERRLNSFHLRYFRRILAIHWQECIPNTEIFQRTWLPSIFALLTQRRLWWLGHVRRMNDGCIPNDLLYSELANGARARGRPTLRYKDTCKRDMRDANINISTWESLAEDHRAWKSAIRTGVEGAAWSSWCRKEPSERRVLLARLPLGLCALPASETDTPALAYTATPESAILELPCAANRPRVA